MGVYFGHRPPFIYNLVLFIILWPTCNNTTCFVDSSCWKQENLSIVKLTFTFGIIQQDWEADQLIFKHRAQREWRGSWRTPLCACPSETQTCRLKKNICVSIDADWAQSASSSMRIHRRATSWKRYTSMSVLCYFLHSIKPLRGHFMRSHIVKWE